MARISAWARLLLAAALAAAAPPAFAQQPGLKNTPPHAKASKSHKAQKPKPIARRAMTPCSEYGAGFVRMAGSDTCVRVGGGIDAGVGFSR